MHTHTNTHAGAHTHSHCGINLRWNTSLLCTVQAVINLAQRGKGWKSVKWRRVVRSHPFRREKWAGGTIKNRKSEMTEEDRREGDLSQIHGCNYCSTWWKPLFLLLIWRQAGFDQADQEGLTGYGAQYAKLFFFILLNFSHVNGCVCVCVC